MTSGDRVSISVSVDGSPIRFAIYSSADLSSSLLDRQNVTSVSEDWTALHNGNFDFYFKILAGIAQVHFTLQKLGAGGGFDPLPIVVVVMVVLAVLVSVFLIVCMRKSHGLPPPPATEEPPPPP